MFQAEKELQQRLQGESMPGVPEEQQRAGRWSGVGWARMGGRRSRGEAGNQNHVKQSLVSHKEDLGLDLGGNGELLEGSEERNDLICLVL